jgi:hypothetical protein
MVGPDGLKTLVQRSEVPSLSLSQVYRHAGGVDVRRRIELIRYWVV